MECTVYDEESAMELWKKMKEIMTSGKTTGEILDEMEEICPEFAQDEFAAGIFGSAFVYRFGLSRPLEVLMDMAYKYAMN